MPGPVVGMFFYLYLIVDIGRRKIVGWEVHERESADLAAALIRRAVLAGGCFMQPLVLHADNGSPPLVHARACIAGQCMKGATMKTTMEKLGITASFSRPRVSNDNPTRRGSVPNLQIPSGLADEGFCHKSRCPSLGEILHQLV